MDTSYIISKMNDFMFRLGQQIGTWLSPKLPRITEDWWQELVLNNLTPLQLEAVIRKNIQEITGLDLASLLRVVNRNWFLLSSTHFMNPRERENVRFMQGIRNFWAHITPDDINKTRVIDDTNVIIALMQTFGAAMKDTRDMEQFIFDVEDDKDIHITPLEEHKKAPEQQASQEPSGSSGTASDPILPLSAL